MATVRDEMLAALIAMGGCLPADPEATEQARREAATKEAERAARIEESRKVMAAFNATHPDEEPA